MSRSCLANTAAAVFTVALCGCLASGCGVSASSEPGEVSLRETAEAGDQTGIGMNDYAAAKTEYDAAASALELPPGMVFREWADSHPDTSGRYEQGLGTADAQAYWVDAWTIEWLEQRGRDAERESKALAVLREFVPASDLMTKYSDQSMREGFKRRLEQAELGDPTGFQQFITVNGITVERETAR